MSASTASQASPALRGVSLEGERFEVAADRPGIDEFWSKADAGRWEGDTFAFIRRHARRDTMFVDVGAWIGPISLYASRHAGKVLALEPDPVAFKDLARNVAANGGAIETWNVGVDVREGELELFAPELGQSTSSAFSTGGAAAVTVKTVTLDQVAARLDPALGVALKVDIEGHEYAMIDAIVAFARRHRAPLHISLHPRSYFTERCRAINPLAARYETWVVTARLIEKLRSLGPVSHNATGLPFTSGVLAKFMFTRRLLKNFSLTVETAGAGKP